MKTMTVGDFKTHFSEVLETIKTGVEIAVSFGKNHKKIAVLVPYEKYAARSGVKLGLLQNRASVTIQKDFAITDESLLRS